jgi:UDP-glucose 6-dehydrogenase
MKKIAIVCLCSLGVVLSLMPSRLCAQPVLTNTPSVWKDLLGGLAEHSALWGTNSTTLADAAPAPASRAKQRHPAARPAPAAPAPLPKDVQALSRQFQQKRDQLMRSLATANDAQRKQTLQQLEQLREQLKSQMSELAAQAREQALDMRAQFGGDFAPGSAAAGGAVSSGHGGRPRL